MSKKFYCPATEILKNKRIRIKYFLNFLQSRYPEPECELTHKNPYELIVATILSAQCTDKQVNKVTPALFEKYPTVESLCNASVVDVEALIKSTGFYKNKAKNIMGMACAVVDRHNCEIPATMEELTKLPGVGRKTANVVLGNAYKVPGMVVDTHVIRISNRLKFVDEKDPVKIESLLEKLVPKSKWVDFSHQVILLGRELCSARGPKCEQCPMNTPEI